MLFQKNKQKNPRMLLISSLVLLLALNTRTAAQNAAEDSSNGWTAFPIVFYTTQTKLAGGVAGLLFFRNHEAVRVSTIGTNLIYTQKKQIITGIGSEIYWRNYSLDAAIVFSKFPDIFYGVGNNTKNESKEDFTSQAFELSANFQRNLSEQLRLGILYEFQHQKITQVEENGVLAQQTLPGTRGAFNVSGMGLVLSWDSRDNTYNPRRGSFHQLSAIFFEGLFGSDYGCARYQVDIRNYTPLFSGHVFAVQGYLQVITGKAPLQLYPVLGNDNLRGYYSRYTDRSLLLFQAEYRLPLWKRFGLALFAGAGDVADELIHQNPQEFKIGAGLGLRYLLIAQTGLNLRVDIGFGAGRNSSFDVFPGEAF